MLSTDQEEEIQEKFGRVGEGEGNVHTHTNTHRHKVEPFEVVEWHVIGQERGSGDRKSFLVFFDPITGEVHRGGK